MNNRADALLKEGVAMTDYTYKRVFQSRLNSIKEITVEVLDYLKHSLPVISAEDLSDLKLIFNELLINAVIHGNKNTDEKKVSLEIEIKANEIIVGTITDEGEGFDYSMLLSQDNLYDDEHLFMETGRGICLVYCLADEVSFNEQGNQIQFRKRMSQHG